MGIDNFLTGKTFLITGATGRLGVDLSLRLEELGASIIPLVTPGYFEKPHRVDWKAKTFPIIYEDADFKSMKPDFVINLHWRVQRNLNFAEQILFETDYNIYRLRHLWDLLKNNPPKSFVNVSSIKIYGEENTGFISADDDPKPDTPYGIVKLAAENFFSTYFKSFFPVTHLRLSSVASEGEHPSQLMSNLYESAFNGKKIKINKSSTTHLLYIDEAVDLIISAALLKSTVKLVIAEDGHLNEELAQMFEKVSSKKLNAEYINNIAVNDDRIFISDKDKLARSWVREYHIEAIMKKIIAVNNKHRSLIYD